MKSRGMFVLTYLLVLCVSTGAVCAQSTPGWTKTDFRSIYSLTGPSLGESNLQLMPGSPNYLSRVATDRSLPRFLAGPQDPAVTFPMILNGAGAHVDWDRELTCGFNDVGVSVFDGVESQFLTSAPNPPQPTKVIIVFVDQFDSCTNQGFVSFGAAAVSGDELQIDRSLRSAFVHATVPLTCVLGPNLGACPYSSVDVDLAWTRISKIEPDSFIFTRVCPGFIVMNVGDKANVALANIAGDVSSGGVSLLTGLSLPFSPSLTDTHITRLELQTPLSQPIVPCRVSRH